jgi:carboxyl-terminal processing protease
VRAAFASALLVVLAAGTPGAQTALRLETFDVAWTVIRDSHFDPGMNGVDWNAVKAELRPKAAAAQSNDDLRTVIRDMLGRLGQSHFALIPAGADASAGGKSDFTADPGFDTRLIERDAVVTKVAPGGSAASAGVKAGWIVEAIDGKPVANTVSAVPDTLPRRLFNVQVWERLHSQLRGPAGSSVRLTFKDGQNRAIPLTLTRKAESGQTAKVGNLPAMLVRLESERRGTPRGNSAGVISFNIWMPAVDALFQKAVDEHRAADGIVIDLRGNPGGLAAMLMGISGHFMTERKPLGVMKTRDSELRFTSNPRLVNSSGERVHPFAGPVAILVDALTGSASECFAGGMQSLGRVRVFGQTTMGQALPAVFQKLPNGDVLIHAYGDFVTATGTRLEGRGVVPDEEVPLTREELLAGRDTTLERALQWIDKAHDTRHARRP